MRVTKTNQTSNRTTTEINLFEDVNVPKSLSNEITDNVGEFLVKKILTDVSKTRSPVSGYGKFKPLSKDYRKEKRADGRGGEANLELTGAMLDSLEFKPTKTGLEVGIFGKEAPKADGHNNFSGKSKLPLRRFLPALGESFKRNIKSDVNNIIVSAIEENPPEISQDELKDIESKSQLWDFLETKYTPFLAKGKIRELIIEDEFLLNSFKSLGIYKWL